MQVITLYKYRRENGGTTVSPIKPDGEYTTLYRLIADEGKALTNGEAVVPCVDTEFVHAWEEIDAAEEPEPAEEQIESEEEA